MDELGRVVTFLSAFEGLELSGLSYQDQWIALKFFSSGTHVSVVLDLRSQSPLLIVTEKRLEPIKGLKHPPIILFLRKYFLQKVLRKVEIVKDLGRVVRFEFEGNEETFLEVRLFPSGANVIAQSSSKKVSLHKPKDLPPVESVPSFADQMRELADVFRQWEDEVLLGNKKKKSPDRSTATDKVQKAKAHLIKDIEQKQKSEIFSLANHLRSQWSIENLPIELSNEIRTAIEAAHGSVDKIADLIFSQEKKLKEKIARSQARLLDLEGSQPRTLTLIQPNLLKVAKSKGRTIQLSSGHLLFVGKSAKDNLLLLRKSRAWDYWFHLRDEVSSHGILVLQKGEQPTESLFMEAASKYCIAIQARPLGGKVNVIAAECRHVHPIKGDKTGRVNYQFEKNILISIP